MREGNESDVKEQKTLLNPENEKRVSKDANLNKNVKSENSKKESNKKNKVLNAIFKKDSAIVNGKGLGMSTKQSRDICRFIRNKHIDRAIYDLEEVSKKKKAVPMKGEIPHRRGKNMMSGRFPVKSSLKFIKLLKSLKANAIVNELELEKYKLSCMSNQASRPFKRFGKGRMKRSHVQIKLIPRKKIIEDKNGRL